MRKKESEREREKKGNYTERFSKIEVIFKHVFSLSFLSPTI
jgi:hypothetical protein